MKNFTRHDTAQSLTGVRHVLTLKQANKVLTTLEETVLVAIQLGYDRITLGRGIIFRISWTKPTSRISGFGDNAKRIAVPGRYRLLVVPTKRLKAALTKRQFRP